MLRNILICTTQVPFTTGGAESHVEGLRLAFIQAGYNAEVVALPFKWYPPGEIMRSALAWRLLDLSEANGKPVDLVIGMKFPAYLAAHDRKVLWIMHQHRSAYNLWDTPFDDLSTYPDGAQVREWIRQADNRIIPQAKKVFANSKTVADRLRRYNGIESQPLYHPPPRAESLRTGEQGDYIFYPSRLEPQKRQELLIEAAQFLQTPVKIVLAGGSGDPRRYESLVKQFGVGNRVSLRGFVPESEIVELYANALGVCYLPFDEDYGYVTLEGMLSGKPVVVAADGGGATEFIDHESEGLIVAPEPRAIAAALDSLYANRDRARAMGKRGQEKLKARNLSWQHVVESLVNGAG
ncbi:MAG TPA: glycosyltransferase family 4 protein [Pyrinomonadaceae bacterium]|jgi:glycosyltransferase involved in cell wall biosynthesis|nr:glycosyltransferase family 4 protein [Pyrinomonadaceae bacterium]